MLLKCLSLTPGLVISLLEDFLKLNVMYKIVGPGQCYSLNQVASDQAFYCSVKVSLVKTQISELQIQYSEKVMMSFLRCFVKPLSSKMEDTRSLGLGNQIRSAYLIIMMLL